MDKELGAVAVQIRVLDPQGIRTARVLRKTFDKLYDGQHTGRFCWDQLYTTESTHAGELVEINLHREFKFQDGEKMDYRIAGTDVDCKYSQKIGGWMIPPEAHGHLCLVISAEDTKTPTWCMGLVRITLERLNSGGNRDRKATLNADGRNAIAWLFKDMPLPPNVLLQIDRETVDGIMAMSSGQKRVSELFRAALCMRVGRAVVATVAQQHDFMKRVRANGGARIWLKAEGIMILGQYRSHAAVARALRVPNPEPGESVSVRVVPAAASGAGVAEIEGTLWRVAGPGEGGASAPDLPKV